VDERSEPLSEAGPPADLRYIDVHVHLHPERLAAAIRRHFADERWDSAHSFEPRAVADTLRRRGVERFCFFSYAHKPAMARSLNRWVAQTAELIPEAIGFGTLHPDDPDLVSVADEATDALGLPGFKFHHSVQRFHVDDSRLYPVYERAEADGHLFVLHVGTMPYRDPYTGIDGFERVMARFPRLAVCVAHMGAFDTARFLALTERYPGMYLDTTMALAPEASPFVGGNPDEIATSALVQYQDRIMFGSDFPLIPYDYDAERRWAWTRGLPAAVQRKIFYDNAARFLRLGAGA
jgi:predicted TIM-barrel fold metal-dependent hydrolase